ncbi:MAG: hypothetical protein HY744_23410 [Deltaproteobacteria bacterium]|nr:hypothetical protein [Deltaproteobacteria bacterium]
MARATAFDASWLGASDEARRRAADIVTGKEWICTQAVAAEPAVVLAAEEITAAPPSATEWAAAQSARVGTDASRQGGQSTPAVTAGPQPVLTVAAGEEAAAVLATGGLTGAAPDANEWAAVLAGLEREVRAGKRGQEAAAVARGQYWQVPRAVAAARPAPLVRVSFVLDRGLLLGVEPTESNHPCETQPRCRREREAQQPVPTIAVKKKIRLTPPACILVQDVKAEIERLKKRAQEEKSRDDKDFEQTACEELLEFLDEQSTRSSTSPPSSQEHLRLQQWRARVRARKSTFCGELEPRRKELEYCLSKDYPSADKRQKDSYLVLLSKKRCYYQSPAHKAWATGASKRVGGGLDPDWWMRFDPFGGTAGPGPSVLWWGTWPGRLARIAMAHDTDWSLGRYFGVGPLKALRGLKRSAVTLGCLVPGFALGGLPGAVLAGWAARCGGLGLVGLVPVLGVPADLYTLPWGHPDWDVRGGPGARGGGAGGGW